MMRTCRAAPKPDTQVSQIVAGSPPFRGIASISVAPIPCLPISAVPTIAHRPSGDTFINWMIGVE
jgi:hypothetical protein